MKFRAATSPTFSVPEGPRSTARPTRGWPPGGLCSRGRVCPPLEAIKSVRAHAPTRSLSHSTIGSLGNGVWLCCISQRGGEGGERQGAWHATPVFCMYVSLANDTPFEDSLLMQPRVESGRAWEGTAHVLFVINGKVWSDPHSPTRAGPLGRSPHASLVLLIAGRRNQLLDP